jgi:uncharacterized protein YdbL (DUF1318 family)
MPIRTRFYAVMVLLLVFMQACVTINVYFPAAAAEQAADRIIQDVLGAAPETQPESTSDARAPVPGIGSALEAVLNAVIPAAHAQQANIDVSTPQIKAITQRMAQRQQQKLKPFFASGAIGFGKDGMIQVRDRSAVSLAQRRSLEGLVKEENNDRKALYREIAVANGHPEWEADIRNTFAKRWIANAPKGWYYQGANGQWTQK